MTKNWPAAHLAPLALAWLIQILPAAADVKLPAIFGSHMVLQQGIKIPVWGKADAGEAVTVTLGNLRGMTTADASGKWRVDLDPVATGTAPLTLTVAGKNTVTFDDVLVGDVWVCSGQSNMEFNLSRAHNAATEIPKADDPLLRLFVVGRTGTLEPLDDVKGAWVLCTPTTAATFSAVGYFFGRDLRQELHRPVGLIGTYFGGTPAQAWTSLSGLQKDPPFTNYVEAYQKIADNFLAATAAFPKAMADYKAQLNQWETAEGPAYPAAMKKWADDSAQAAANHQPTPPRPQPTHPRPIEPAPPNGGSGTPTGLFNAMVAPLIPYAIKGVIWYQGENNAGNGYEYRTLFPRMISDWREKWGQGDFPFLFVQLARLGRPQVNPSEGGWAFLREAQLMTLALPNTGMAVAFDVGNPNDIHPQDKLDVAQRLFLAARHVAYGEEGVYSGPIFERFSLDQLDQGGKIAKVRVSFTNTGGGLEMANPPWTPDGTTLPAPTELKGFALAGADQKWAWATAQIDGKDVVLTSDKVPSPVAVRYSWSQSPIGNLYNKEGLPASPFRTDNWEPPKPAPPPAPAIAPAPAPTPTPAP